MNRFERRARARGLTQRAWSVLYQGMRFTARHVGAFYAALGIVLVAGAALAVAATWAFVALAGVVREGATQQFDDRVLQWIGAHQTPLMQKVMFEITLLGTGIVLVMTVCVAGLFLWISNHRFSALLLLLATCGGIVINTLLKHTFDRPRPQIFEWGATVLTSSFPSGHAMSATITYGTIAYLAARLQAGRVARWITYIAAGLLIILICTSRLYLGVHYPSDVVAGSLMGIAWTGFCMATLEAIQVFGQRYRPQILEHEEPAPAAEPDQGTAGGGPPMIGAQRPG